MNAPAEVPQDQQLAAAATAVDHAASTYTQARDAMHAKRGAYTRARQTDPAAQSTDQARQAWADALHAEADAKVAYERACDEFTAIHRQTAEYAIGEVQEGGGGS